MVKNLDPADPAPFLLPRRRRGSSLYVFIGRTFPDPRHFRFFEIFDYENFDIGGENKLRHHKAAKIQDLARRDESGIENGGGKTAAAGRRGGAESRPPHPRRKLRSAATLRCPARPEKICDKIGAYLTILSNFRPKFAEANFGRYLFSLRQILAKIC